LIEQLESEHVVGQTTEPHFAGSMHTVYYYDFIAHDFFWKIIPQPDMFELKQVAAIPVPEDIEERHELMISIILDRIRNAATYEQQHFSKCGKSWWYHEKRSSHYSKYSPSRRAIMKDCNHNRIPEIEDSLYKNQDDGIYEIWDKIDERKKLKQKTLNSSRRRIRR
jgi:hypothetical protein